VDILSPIEEVICLISARLASISIVIPYICVLSRKLKKNKDDSGVRTIKGEILHSLKSCFAGTEEKEQLLLSPLYFQVYMGVR